MGRSPCMQDAGPSAPARDARPLDRPRCPRRQLKRKTGRPADPGPQFLSIQYVRSGSSERSEGSFAPPKGRSMPSAGLNRRSGPRETAAKEEGTRGQAERRKKGCEALPLFGQQKCLSHQPSLVCVAPHSDLNRLHRMMASLTSEADGMLTISTASAGAGHLPTVRFTLVGCPNSQTDIARLSAPSCASLLVEHAFYEQLRNVAARDFGRGSARHPPACWPPSDRGRGGGTPDSPRSPKKSVCPPSFAPFSHKYRGSYQEISAARCRGDSEMVAGEF
jgi:hypothetical protein